MQISGGKMYKYYLKICHYEIMTKTIDIMYFRIVFDCT